VSYRAGDHLSIVPQNAAALVERALRRFAFAPGAYVMLAAAEGRRAICRSARRSPSIACCRTSSNCSIRRRASRSRPWRSTRAAFTRPRLEALLDEERFRAEILTKRKSVLDLLEEHPACELPLRHSWKCCR